jgi:hypothetical protein
MGTGNGNTGGVAYTALYAQANGRGFAGYINLGRNNPDGWPTYNGLIGDTYVYDEQLSPADLLRVQNSVRVAMGIGLAAKATTIGFFTDSDQLNLDGRDVLAAVNFYDPARIGDGQRTVGVIQGVDFDDFRNNVDDTGSPITLLAGAVGTTLSTVIPQSPGREFYSPNALFGTFLPGSLDNTEAENLANGGAYYQTGDTGTLTFAFSGITEPTAVEVQMIGGGAWDQGGVLTATVGNVVGTTIVENASTGAQLLTFVTTTDASGGLVIDLAETGNRYVILSGMTVTVAH